jgi:predicted transcriptional regulator
MLLPGFSKLELKIMEVLWQRGRISIREVQEALSAPQPAYTSVQTTIYRLETKHAVRRVRKIGNAHIFEASVSRNAAHGRLLDHVLGLFGGRIQPVMAHWAESGNITEQDVEDAERLLRELAAPRRRSKIIRRERKHDSVRSQPHLAIDCFCRGCCFAGGDSPTISRECSFLDLDVGFAQVFGSLRISRCSRQSSVLAVSAAQGGDDSAITHYTGAAFRSGRCSGDTTLASEWPVRDFLPEISGATIIRIVADWLRFDPWAPTPGVAAT